MKTIFSIIIILICYLNRLFAQKIILKPNSDTIIGVLNIETTIINNTKKSLKLVPFPDRRWTIDLSKNGHNYREPEVINVLDYPNLKIKFKRIRKKYKFSLQIDFTKLQMDLGYKDFTSNSVDQWDTVLNKFGYDKNITFNQDFGKYKLMIKYDFYSDKPDQICHLKSDTIDIEYKNKKTAPNTVYKP